VVSQRRKVVTVVFADVVGSTALGERVDAETLRWAMQRWFDRMREVVERHGGAIENYIGDAVMAVFGIPVAHEDDALRAVRAAAEMRDAVVGLGDELRRARGVELAVRIGVNTGEAVTGAGAAAGSFTAGDMVNVAARLEQAAGAGDILLGRDTFRLVRHAVEAEPVAPLTVKGKSAAVEAFRLVAVALDVWGRAQRQRAPMVGRQRERRQVLDVFHHVVADRSCQLLTVLGAAGVGKSRLVAEVLTTIDGAATVAAGRCLPYGDGLTWWPLLEALGAGRMLEQAAAVDSAATARVAELLKLAGAAVVPEEAFWAVRKVLEEIARRRPLVLVIDDLQWAEPVFVDLIEYVAEWTRDAPLLLLIMARPELLDTRPWDSGRLNARTVLLEPLRESDARDLLGHLTGSARLDHDTAARILATAEGNPLFVEEIVAMLIDDDVVGPGQAEGTDVAGPPTMAVPPTIQALIAARLDRLDECERAVIEAASIEGKEFTRDRVEALVDDARSESLDAQLRALIRKDLIRSVGAGDDTFRFRHQLIRDGAYDGIPKQLRADLHERFAKRLGMAPLAVPVADELLGHHLERAVLLRRELGATEAATAELAARASTTLRAAGGRAVQRDDPASIRLLERALALTPQPDHAPMMVELATAFQRAGDLERCATAATAALELARANDDRRTAARARTVSLEVAMYRWEGDGDLASLDAATEPVLHALEELDDDEGITRILLLRGWINVDHFERAAGHLERALALAERTGDRKAAALAAGTLGLITVFGPLTASKGIERCRELRRRVPDHRIALARLLSYEAVLHAMQGRLDQARALQTQADDIIEDLGSPMLSANNAWAGWALELLAGAPERAEAAARASLDLFTAMGATGNASTAAALLAVALVRRGRHDEALRNADLAAAWAAPDDIASQVHQFAARAHVLASRGDFERAEAAAREAVRFSQRSDDISQRGDALADLAAVLDRAGRAGEAAAALRDAIALYERKGNIVCASRARATVKRLDGPDLVDAT